MPKHNIFYITPSDFKCPYCNTQSKIVPNYNEFSHEFGIEYPIDWGLPMCSECNGILGEEFNNKEEI